MPSIRILCSIDSSVTCPNREKGSSSLDLLYQPIEPSRIECMCACEDQKSMSARCIRRIVQLRAYSLKRCVSTRGVLIDSERAGAEPCLWSRQAVGDGGC